jgi:hypothetical protein
VLFPGGQMQVGGYGDAHGCAIIVPFPAGNRTVTIAVNLR